VRHPHGVQRFDRIGIPQVEVEAEGPPLLLVRAVEAELQRVVRGSVPVAGHGDLSGPLFLAEAALQEADQPVPPAAAVPLLTALSGGRGWSPTR
jgi:hypothetical protein